MNLCITRGLIQPVIMGGALLALATSASAGLVSTSVNSSDPFGAETSFLSGTTESVTETFEDDSVGEKTGGMPSEFSTSVGDFDVSGSPGDDSGQCGTLGSGDCDELWVLDQTASPFSGRYDTTDGDRDVGDEEGHWLDSNDVTAFTWDIDSSVTNPTAFGFFLMDPSDVGAELTVSFDDGGSPQTVALINGENNGELFYVSAVADTSIASAMVTFANTDGNTDGDGFGVDNVTVARVPEPATLGLLGAGLMGLGFGFRQNQAV